jgi:hypothetical protein
MTQEQKINTLLVLAVLLAIVTGWLAWHFNKYVELQEARWNEVFTQQ